MGNSPIAVMSTVMVWLVKIRASSISYSVVHCVGCVGSVQWSDGV